MELPLESIAVSYDDSGKPNIFLGSGSFGSVYEGLYLDPIKNDWVPCACKFVSPIVPLQAVKSEVAAMMQVRHKNIARVYGWYKDTGTGQAVIVTELAPGGSLKKLLEGGGEISMERRAEIAASVARAILTLHDNDIIHGDIKPENVLIGEKGVVKLADFGLAVMMDGESVVGGVGGAGGSGHGPAAAGAGPAVSLGGTHSMFGTLHYMAPELFPLDGKKASPRSKEADIYAFGILLWCLYTRKQPYADQAAELIPQATGTLGGDDGGSNSAATTSAGPLFTLSADSSTTSASYSPAGEELAAGIVASAIFRTRAGVSGRVVFTFTADGKGTFEMVPVDPAIAFQKKAFEKMGKAVQEGARPTLEREGTSTLNEGTPAAVKKWIEACWCGDAKKRPTAGQVMMAFDPAAVSMPPIGVGGPACVADAKGWGPAKVGAVPRNEELVTVHVAGTGTGKSDGDGLLGTNAGIHYPWGVFTGPDGDLWVCEWGGGKIRAVSKKDGTIRTVAMLEGATWGMAMPGTDFALVGGGGGKPLKLKANGTMTPDVLPGVTRVHSAAFSHISGEVVCVEERDEHIKAFKLQKDGTFVLSRTIYAAGLSKTGVYRVAVHPVTGLVHISDGGNDRVLRVENVEKETSSGGDGWKGTLTKLNIPGLSCPDFIVFDAVGSMFVSSFAGCNVMRVEQGGSVSVVAGKGAPNRLLADQIGPVGVFVEEDGSLVVSDCSNQKVWRLKRK